MILPLPLIRVIAGCAIAVALMSPQAEDIATIRHKSEAGNAEAQFELARAYYTGTGVAKDPRQGLEWLRKSAFQGYAAAEFALAVMYQLGEQSISQNPHEAAHWFRKAARQQNKEAQTRLSQMFDQGLISEQEANWRTSEPPTTQVKKAKPKPFSLGEVERGLLGGITSKRMAALVDMFGVDFRLSAVTRKRLSDEGADDSLLTTIAVSQRSL